MQTVNGEPGREAMMHVEGGGNMNKRIVRNVFASLAVVAVLVGAACSKTKVSVKNETAQTISGVNVYYLFERK